MSDNEEATRVLLAEDVNRRIVRLCKNPRTTAEIIRHLTPERPQYNAYYYETLVGNSLRVLEVSGLLSFSEGKWTASEQALAVLEKYFGG